MLLLVLLFAAGCGRAPEAAATGEGNRAGPVRLRDVAAEAGVRFRHTSGASGRLYLAETLGSGGAVFDYDGDGRLDLFLVNSSRLPGFTEPGPFYPALYRQKADGTFEEVTRKAGLAVDHYGMGVAVGDYDGDGHRDLYLTALGPDRLFRNRGDGTFEEVTARVGIDAPEWNVSAAWVDYDRDGDLDLFVGGYCRWTPATNQDCPDSRGHKHLCSPKLYPGVSSRLYRNEGGRRFTDVTEAAGVHDEAGKTLAVLVWDENDDGWPDLMLANDLEPDLLYRNQKDGTFREVAVEVGLAYSQMGKARAGMGLDSADLDGHGRESLLVGNFSAEGLGLYRPDPSLPAGQEAQFVDMANTAGLVPASLPFLTFAVLFCDFDLDGHPDILTANGHIDPNVEKKGPGTTFLQRLQLFRGLGAGRFSEATAEAGESLLRPGLYRGLAVGDWDGDGDPDVLVTANNGPPLLLENEGRPRHHWLQVRLQGRGRNRDGLGARVRVTARGRTQTGWIRSGGSYASSHDARACFGLGKAGVAERVEVRWPTGEVQTVTNIAANQVLTLKQ